MNSKTIKKIIFTIGLCVGLAVFAEWIYFQSVFQNPPNNLQTCDAVLVYGGSIPRSVQGLKLANRLKVPLFLSECYGDAKDVEKKIGPVETLVTVDHYARTTDQNARNAVPFLKRKNFKRVLLVTNWFHMPRALFLTRLYLLGTGITVQPYYFEAIPQNIYVQSDFWIELVRFWGSLGRVALASIGIVTGPR